MLVLAARHPAARQTYFSFMMVVSMDRFQWTVSPNEALVRERRAAVHYRARFAANRFEPRQLRQ
jgi:hypothetical protein